MSACSTVLVYVDSGRLNVPWLFRHTKNNFIHNYIVVTPDPNGSGVRVADVFKCSIGRYRPSVPRNFSFDINIALRDFLLYKLINADRAAAHCRENECLDIIRRRNRQSLIDAVVEGSKSVHKHHSRSHSQSLSSPSDSSLGTDSPTSPRLSANRVGVMKTISQYSKRSARDSAASPRSSKSPRDESHVAFRD